MMEDQAQGRLELAAVKKTKKVLDKELDAIL